MALTPEEQKELDELTGTSGLSPEEEAELALLQGETEVSKPTTLKDKALTGLGYVGKGLGYAGGLTRAALAQRIDDYLTAARTGAGVVQGKSPKQALEDAMGKRITRPEDIPAALRGEAPIGSEYLERAGVPQGATASDILPSLYSETGKGIALERGGMLDPSARGAAGFAIDAATDPLTYLSAGTAGAARGVKAASDASRLAKAANAARNVGVEGLNATAGLTERLGKALYKSGWKGIDNRLTQKGLEPVADYALAQNMWGGAKSLKGQMDQRTKVLGELRKKLYKKADDAGAVVNPNNAEDLALERIAEMSGQGYGATQKADSMLETLAQKPSFDRAGGLSLDKASAIKTNLYDSLPQSAFTADGRLTSEGQEMLKNLSRGYKEEIVGAGNRAVPGLGDEVNVINQEMGAYLGAAKPTRQEIAKASNKNVVTQVKAALLGLNPKLTAAMYGAEGLNSPVFRTGAGLLLNRGGQATRGYLDPALRQLLNEQYQESIRPQSPWTLLDK